MSSCLFVCFKGRIESLPDESNPYLQSSPRYSRVHNSPPFGLFMKENAYVPVGGNEGGGEATPTSILIFDSYDIKTL